MKIDRTYQKKRLLGILGGMGPEAGVEFVRILIEKTPANRDQDHIPFLLLNYPQVPDRTNFILGKGTDPVPVINRGLKILEKAGVTHAVIPCNTAHIFMDRIKSATNIFLYDLIQESLFFTKDNLQHIKKIGLLATKGTLISKVYERYFKDYTIIVPDTELEEQIHEAIYNAAKRSKMKDAVIILKKAVSLLVEREAEAVILGCTEVETALRKESLPIPSIKPMEAVVEKILKEFLPLKDTF